MKKLLPIVLVATAFALVGCSTHKTPKSTMPDTSMTQTKEKCKKHHRHHHGKLGVEKTTKDTAK